MRKELEKMRKYQLGDLSLRVYEPENKPRAVVEVAHGMEEHQGRYAPVAEYLTKKGFAVVTADMRGHGEGVAPERLGFFAERDGYRRLIDDQLEVRDFIGERFPDLPVYLLAHSMGTIISRCVLEKHSERYDKVVLTGFPCTRKGVGFGIFLADVQSAMFGADHRSGFMQRLSTGVFNKAIENPATEHDWICSDPWKSGRMTKPSKTRWTICLTGWNAAAPSTCLLYTSNYAIITFCESSYYIFK